MTRTEEREAMAAAAWLAWSATYSGPVTDPREVQLGFDLQAGTLGLSGARRDRDGRVGG